MYLIEYCKNEKNTEFKKLINSKNTSITNQKNLYQKNLANVCQNVKSITIDLEDIKMMKFLDDSILLGLYARFSNQKRNAFVTIPNNGQLNCLYIYHILKNEWLIDQENADKISINNIINRIDWLKIEIRNTKDIVQKAKLEKELLLSKYALNTLIKYKDVKNKEAKKKVLTNN